MVRTYHTGVLPVHPALFHRIAAAPEEWSASFRGLQVPVTLPIDLPPNTVFASELTELLWKELTHLAVTPVPGQKTLYIGDRRLSDIDPGESPDTIVRFLRINSFQPYHRDLILPAVVPVIDLDTLRAVGIARHFRSQWRHTTGWETHTCGSSAELNGAEYHLSTTGTTRSDEGEAVSALWLCRPGDALTELRELARRTDAALLDMGVRVSPGAIFQRLLSDRFLEVR